MSWYHYFVLFTLSLVTISAIMMAFYFKSRIKEMSGMILSMATGMNVGLTAGVLFGSLYQGQLYYSTIVSILIGMIVGATCGIAFGILSSLEGFMSGLMGSMMGAMLGEMLTPSQSVIMINILLTLSVCSLILFQILPKPLEKESSSNDRKWIYKPILTFLFLAIYLLFGTQLDKQLILSNSNTTGEKKHTNHTTQEIHNKTVQNELTINVQPGQFSYVPQKITVKKDQAVSLFLKNFDSIDHDIEIKQFSIAKKGNRDHESHLANEEFLHLHASAKMKSKTTFIPLETGTYEFYCTISGHKENGMIGILIVL